MLICLIEGRKDLSLSLFLILGGRTSPPPPSGSASELYCQNTIQPKKDTKLCLRVEKWSRSVQHLFFLFLHKACWILLFVSFSYRIRQCFRSSTIRFVPCAFFINKQFRTCANVFPNEFTVRSYEYCAGKHWILY
jgi:hypothetical protein